MTGKQEIFLIIGAILIVMIALLATPNPNFTSSDITAKTVPSVSNNLVKDSSFALGSESAWKFSEKEGYKKDQAASLTTLTFEKDTTINQTLENVTINTAESFDINYTIQNTISDTQAKLFLQTMDGKVLFSQKLHAKTPGTSRFVLTQEIRTQIAKAGTSILVSLEFPGKSTFQLSQLEIIPLYNLKK